MPDATVDSYIRQADPKVKRVLRKIRSVIRRAAPQATERISYRMPAFFQNGALIYFAAFRTHIGLYPPVSGDRNLMAAVRKYAGPRGNLKIPLDRPIPYALIGRIVKARLKVR